jgi:hypothetical protein
MGCFSMSWLEQFLVWCVIVGAIIAIIRLVVPWVMSQVGIPLLAQAINIILWAVVCIFVIYIIFALLSCVVGMGGVGLLPPHR